MPALLRFDGCRCRLDSVELKRIGRGPSPPNINFTFCLRKITTSFLIPWKGDPVHYIQSKSILSAGNGMNLYRGCTHGCIYCDSRSTCYQMDHAFEDVAVKENGLQLLESALKRKRKPCMIGTGSMTDPYIPLEEKLRYVRQSLSLIERYGFGFSVITKSDRILQDLEQLQRINSKTKCVVQMTLTTYDDALCRILEPNVCPTSRRVEVLKILRDAGIPTVVWLCPILPYINDTEQNISALLRCCAEAGVYGVICFGMGLTLREGNREYFYACLDRSFPGLKEQYIREFGNSYMVMSRNNRALMTLLHETCERNGMLHSNDAIFSYLRTFEEKQPEPQLSLWDL